jgi:hypothetical protein
VNRDPGFLPLLLFSYEAAYFYGAAVFVCIHIEIYALPPRPPCSVLAGGKKAGATLGKRVSKRVDSEEYRYVDFGTAFGTGNAPYRGLHEHARRESLKRTFSVLPSWLCFSFASSPSSSCYELDLHRILRSSPRLASKDTQFGGCTYFRVFAMVVALALTQGGASSSSPAPLYKGGGTGKWC